MDNTSGTGGSVMRQQDRFADVGLNDFWNYDLTTGRTNFAQVEQPYDTFDYKVLNENWKIGMKGNDFLPEDWKTPEIYEIPLDYDQMIRTEGWKIGRTNLAQVEQPYDSFDYKLLNEGWKVGMRGNDFLPEDWKDPEENTWQ